MDECLISLFDYNNLSLKNMLYYSLESGISRSSFRRTLKNNHLAVHDRTLAQGILLFDPCQKGKVMSGDTVIAVRSFLVSRMLLFLLVLVASKDILHSK